MSMKEWKAMQSFRNVEEMDEHVSLFIKRNPGRLSEGNYNVLRLIWRHSTKIPGVSFMKVETITEGAGVSRRTVIRSINRLEEMGIVKRVEWKKPNGKRGVNVLILQPQPSFLPDDDTPCDTPSDTAGTTGKSCPDAPEAVKSHPETEKKQKRNFSCKKDGREPVPGSFDISYLSSTIPEAFARAASPFLQLAEIEQGWTKVLQVYGKMKALQQPVEEYIHLLVPVWKQVIYAYKMNRVKVNLFAYFHGALEETFTRQVRREVHDRTDLLYYDWLEEEGEERCV